LVVDQIDRGVVVDDEAVDEGRVTELGRDVEHRVAFPVDAGHRQTRVQEPLDGVKGHGAAGRCPVGGVLASGGVDEVRVRAVGQEQVEDGHLVVQGRPVEGRVSALVALDDACDAIGGS
jgi:hypothetical protein